MLFEKGKEIEEKKLESTSIKPNKYRGGLP